jgi:micrococcal nuclease
MGNCTSLFRRKSHNKSVKRTLEADPGLVGAEFGEYFSFAGHKLKAKIVSVYDGDTCTAIFRFPYGDTESGKGTQTNLIQYRIRLNGLDCPEMKPPLKTENRESIVASAKKAKEAVEDKILGRIVTLECHEFDKYGRILGTIMLEDGTNLNKWLLEQGYAVAYDGGTKS